MCVCAVCVSSDGLKAMGFKHPNAVLGKLKAGEVIVLPDGTRLDPDNDVYVTKTRPGRRMVFLGDTCDPYGMLDLARDCDLLVHEVSERGESSYNCLVHHWSVGLEAMGRNRLGAASGPLSAVVPNVVCVTACLVSHTYVMQPRLTPITLLHDPALT